MTITKTNLYSFDPLNPHFYTVKLGFREVYINILISAQTHRLWVLRGSNKYPQSMFWAEIWKLPECFIWKFSFLVVKFSIHLNMCVFVMRLKRSLKYLSTGFFLSCPSRKHAEAALTSIQNLCCWAEIWKISEFLSENLFSVVKFSIYLNNCLSRSENLVPVLT